MSYRKIIDEVKRKEYLIDFKTWFTLIETDAEGNLTFVDAIGNLIYYYENGRTNIISFKLLNDDLEKGTRCRVHTFRGAIAKFKKFNIQKKMPA